MCASSLVLSCSLFRSLCFSETDSLCVFCWPQFSLPSLLATPFFSLMLSLTPFLAPQPPLTPLFGILQAFLTQSQLYHESFVPSTFQAHLRTLAEPLAGVLTQEVEDLEPGRFRAGFDDGRGVEEVRMKVEDELDKRLDA